MEVGLPLVDDNHSGPLPNQRVQLVEICGWIGARPDFPRAVSGRLASTELTLADSQIGRNGADEMEQHQDWSQ